MGALPGVQRPQPVQPIVARPVAEMPDREDPALKAARKKKQEELLGTAGRRSTILTAPGERSGSGAPADSYGSTRMGSAA